MTRKISSWFRKPGENTLLTLPIDCPEMLDALWSEFIKTKDPRFVERVVSVLDAKDAVRVKLERWLLTANFDDPATVRTRDLLVACVFPINFITRIVNSPLDIDLHVALLARAGKLRFEQLPFQLAPGELLGLAMKSAALWSLTSMAEQHAQVAEICDQESKKPGGASRVQLAKLPKQP